MTTRATEYFIRNFNFKFVEFEFVKLRHDEMKNRKSRIIVWNQITCMVINDFWLKWMEWDYFGVYWSDGSN